MVTLHILTNVNGDQKLADCTVCGPTRIRMRSDNRRWRCSTSEKAARYGLQPGELNKLLKQQSGKCAICSRKMWNPNIDHDHKTGVVRGLLCSNCNTGIGLLGDSPRTLFAAIDYLSKMR